MWVLKWCGKETLLFDVLTCLVSEFQRGENATGKARVVAYVLTLGTGSKGKPDERSPLGLGPTEIDTMILQKKESDRKLYRVWKWCKNEREAKEVISGVAQI